MTLLVRFDYILSDFQARETTISSHIHKHTNECFLPHIAPDSWIPVPLIAISASLEPLIEWHEHMHNSVCIRAGVSVCQLWCNSDFKIWKYKWYTDRRRPSLTRWSPLMGGSLTYAIQLCMHPHTHTVCGQIDRHLCSYCTLASTSACYFLFTCFLLDLKGSI